jgi:hypothetical protein
MSRLPRSAGLLLATAMVLTAPFARALDAGEVHGEPLTIDVTETAVLNYNFDNRNTKFADVKTRVDDDWGEWRNRLNVQASWWRLVLGIRVDSSEFFHTPNPNTLTAEDLANRPAPLPGEIPPTDEEFKAARTQEYGAELSNRYLNAIYPSKLYLSYTTPGLEITAGDLYAQFGRGLVLSVRKVDEIAVDTTIRGGKAMYKLPLPKGTKGSVTALGGYMNPVRIDETSGRVLQAPRQWLFAGMPQPRDTYYVPDAQPNFVPDRVLGASAEGGIDQLTVGVHGVLLDRAPPCALYDRADPCTPFLGNTGIRAADQVRNASASLSLPDIAGHGSFYLEAASQQQRSVHPDPDEYDPDARWRPRDKAEDLNGYAVYSSVSANAGPVAITFEGKHYRKFFPLLANVQMAGTGQATEFQLLQYSAPPTTLPIYVDTESNNFNTCVTGGRARVDARATDDLLVYAWVGRYATWGEHGPAECETRDIYRNDVWDTAIGLEAFYEQKRSHVFAWAGARDDQMAQLEDPTTSDSTTYYREGYVRYDLVKMIHGTWSVQVTGVARHRFDPSKQPLAYWEGENYAAIQWSPKLTAAFGYEYITREGEPGSYYNGSVKWRFNSDTSVRVFVGQQRGAMRCIAGVCRQFPPFEGAKAEAIVRF